MTIWFVVPANRETAFRSAYLGEKVRGKDNPNEDEAVGVMQPNADGSKLFTGSSRITEATAQKMQNGTPPWLEVYNSWPPPGGWEYPE